MKKNKATLSLSWVPVMAGHITWEADATGLVTLCVKNTGWANRIAQALFHRPPVSYVRLDALGSFVWRQVDGQHSITGLAQLVEADFGETAHPLYERLVTYLRILHSYGFIRWA
ncbi:MAG: PqqD family protein [Clostridia bacterium]|nr:PqqD family protein [Clostridia bacterium]